MGIVIHVQVSERKIMVIFFKCKALGVEIMPLYQPQDDFFVCLVFNASLFAFC